MPKKNFNLNNTFLKYANLSFRDDPESLYLIVKQINDDYSLIPALETWGVGHLAKRVMTIAKYNDPEVIKKIEKRIKKQKMESREEAHMLSLLYIASGIVFGYQDGYCENECFWRGYSREIIDHSLFTQPDHIKCFQCEQVRFTKILEGVIEGKEYKDIVGFEDLLYNSQKYFKREISIRTAENNKFKQDLKERLIFQPQLSNDELWKPKEKEISMRLWKNVFDSFTGNSLINFLLNNDRRKLKRCSYCNDFFIAKNIRRGEIKEKTRYSEQETKKKKIACEKPECLKKYKANDQNYYRSVQPYYKYSLKKGERKSFKVLP